MECDCFCYCSNDPSEEAGGDGVICELCIEGDHNGQDWEEDDYYDNEEDDPE